MGLEPRPPLLARLKATFRSICTKIVKAFKAVFAPSIHSFFLWSSLLYLACGCAILITTTNIMNFLCKVPPENPKEGTDKPCEWCPDRLSLCGKSSCMQSALNITYVQEAKLSTGPLYKALASAATNTQCADFAKSATSIEGMLTFINDASSTELEDCKNFWCAMLNNVIVNTDLSRERAGVEASVTMNNCTNANHVKRPSESTACVCQATRDAVISGSYTALIDSCRISVAGASIRRLPAEPTEPTALLTSAAADLERRLQATPAPASNVDNADLQDYQVEAWSPCSCYMQCMPGVRTRLVQCLAARCRAPKPATKEACTCDHCAQCRVYLNLYVLTITFLTQGSVAFLVFLAFAYYETQSEDSDNLVKVPLLMKPLGFFCKQLPPIVRIFMLVNFFQLLVILIQTWIPSRWLAFHPDCNESIELASMTMSAASIWVVQLIMGKLAKKFTRKPPYLYSPERPGGIPGLSHLKALLRSLGP